MLSSPRHDVFLLMSLTQPHWLTQTSCASSHLSHTHPVSPASWLLFMLALRALAGFRTGPGRPVPAAGTGAYAWGGAQVPGQSLRFLERNWRTLLQSSPALVVCVGRGSRHPGGI